MSRSPEGLSTSYQAKLTALREAARLIKTKVPPPTNVVFVNACRSAIQGLQSPSEQPERATQYHLLQCTTVTIWRIPAHCDLVGNEEVDRLVMSGSRLEQPNQPVSYSEAKTCQAAIQTTLDTLWGSKDNS